ncbi:isoprenoid synthase domain-containing protein [Mycena galopus ATCC 62051]|nr:isoprenoid synthase domain-containing protein [Mycena galopus ATCC 62051]
MLYLPKTMRTWPWPGEVGPYYRTGVSEESAAWFATFSESIGQYPWHHRLDKVNFGVHRFSCDMMRYFLAYDEYTDTNSAALAKELEDVVIDVIHNPNKLRPKGEIFFGQAAKELLEMLTEFATPTCVARFRMEYALYVKAVTVEVENREGNKWLTVEAFFPHRRESGAMRMSWSSCEFDLHIPDEAMDHPVVKEIKDLAADILVIDNDILSYNREQSLDNSGCNIVTVAMRQFNVDAGGAICWACDHHYELEARFLTLCTMVPSFSPEVDKALKTYIDNIGYAVAGNVEWSFEDPRYMGTHSREIQQTRFVEKLASVGRGGKPRGLD